MVPLFLSLFLLATSNAHILINSPKPRGFNESSEHIGPCGGFNVTTARTTVSVKQSLFISVVEHVIDNVTVRLGLGDNPKTFPTTMVQVKNLQMGNQSIQLDFTPYLASLVGSKATIQVQSVDLEGTQYLCADVMVNSVATSTTTSSSAFISIPSTTSVSSAATARAVNGANVVATSVVTKANDALKSNASIMAFTIISMLLLVVSLQ